MNVEKTYEQAIEELEKVITQLEKGDLPLEKSLEVFKKGVELVNFCNIKLNSIEKKISILIEGKDGEFVEKPFEEENK